MEDGGVPFGPSKSRREIEECSADVSGAAAVGTTAVVSFNVNSTGSPDYPCQEQAVPCP